VPTLTGMTKTEAIAALEKNGFDIGDASETSSNQPRGTVIATRPAAGSQVSIPTTVNLILSGGTATIDMPNLVGRDVQDARQTLLQLGAKDVQVLFDPMALGAKGTVVGQSPVAGASLPPGGQITLRVSGEGTP
jgi:serine/threonine-protein kinase